MMPVMIDGGCPGRERLTDLLLGRLPERQAQVLGRHLDQCDNCRLEIAELEADQSSIVQRRLPASSERQSQRLGQYELLERIGAGGMGVVYRARQVGLNRIVALKTVGLAEAGLLMGMDRFRTEAEAAARLDHPGIVPVYEVGEELGRLFFSMAYLKGGSLADRLSEQLLSDREASVLLIKVAEAIAYAHSQGVIHRDLKPSNILLDDANQPKVSDFGLAKIVGVASDLTATGQILGTPSYMPPEQAHGDVAAVDERSDVYALGAVLYRALVGRAPFHGESPMKTLYAVIHEEPIPPRQLVGSIDRDLETICLKCLEKLPENRYQSATEVAEELRRFQNDEPILARPPGRIARVRRWCRRHRREASLLFATVLTLIAGTLASVSFALLASWRADHISNINRDLQQANTTAVLAVDRARRSEEVAVEQRSLAEHHRRQVEQQLDEAHRMVYAMQLNKVNAIWSLDPPRARDLLNDDQCCPLELREFTWQLFSGLCSREVAVMEGHESSVIGAAILPESDVVISISSDRTMRRWNWKRGQPSQVIAHFEGIPSAFAVSPDGRWIAAADSSTSILRLLPAAAPAQERPVHLTGERIISTSFSPDSRRLAIVTDQSISICNIDSGLVSATRNDRKFRHVAFVGDDGGQLALSSQGGNCILWDLSERREVRRFMTDESSVRRLSVSPDFRYLALTHALGGLDLFQISDGSRVARFETPGVFAGPVVFTSNGRKMYAAGSDKLIREWDIPTGRQVAAVAAHGDNIWSLALDDDEQFLATASGDRTIKIWNVDTYQSNPAALNVHVRKPLCLVTSPDGQVMAMGGMDGNVWVSTWKDPFDWRTIGRCQSGITQVVFAPDGSRLFSADVAGSVVLWSASTGEMLKSWQHGKTIFAIAISADGRVLAVVTQGGDLILRDLESDSVETIPLGEDGWSLEFSPDGRLLTLGTEQGGIWLLDVATCLRQRVAVMEGKGLVYPASGVVDLSYSPDATYCAAATRAGLVTLFDAQTWTPIRHFRGHSSSVNSIAFSADGLTLATGTGMLWEDSPGEVKLWDVRGGYNLATFEGRGGPLVFSPDDSQLLTAGNNSGLYLFTAALRSPSDRGMMSGDSHPTANALGR